MAGIPGLILNRGCCRFSALTRFFAFGTTQPPGEPWMIATHLPGRGLLGTERVDLGHSEAGPFLSTHLQPALRGRVFGAFCNVWVCAGVETSSQTAEREYQPVPRYR